VRQLRLVICCFTLLPLALPLIGCDGRSQKNQVVLRPARPERGPHDFPLALWGHECALEVCIDRSTHEAIVYVFDPVAATPHPIDARTLTLVLDAADPPVEVLLLPEPQPSRSDGKAISFRGKDPAFAGEACFYGTISGKVGETSYEGEFDERARSPVKVLKHPK
jgi:hypothetical protein